MNEIQPLEDKIIVQAKSGLTLTFDFRADALHYEGRGPVDAIRFATPYENILVRNPSYLTVNNTIFARRFFFAYLAVMAVLIGVPLYFRLDPDLSFFAILICFVGFIVLRMKSPFSLHFTLLAAAIDSGSDLARELRILEDEAGPEILDEIERRRTARLRALHAFVDPAGHPAAEAAKFDWLKQQGVIDETEYETAMAQLREAGLGEGPSLH